MGSTRARAPSHISDGSSCKVVFFVLFFRSISVECTSPLNGALKQNKNN